MHILLIADGFTKWHRFIRRWGISFLLGEKILFDTFGDEKVFLNNVRKFYVDLSKIRHIVISHDDWDHIAGLWPVLERYKDLTVYICPSFAPEIKQRIRSYGVKCVEVEKPLLIDDKIWSTGELPGISKGRVINEQSLVVKTSEGLALLCGCAHPKVADIVQFAEKQFNEKVVYLIGGFHLKDNSDNENRAIIDSLRKSGVRDVVPLHCTGRLARNLISKIFGDGYSRIREGQMLEL